MYDLNRRCNVRVSRDNKELLDVDESDKNKEWRKRCTVVNCSDYMCYKKGGDRDQVKAPT